MKTLGLAAALALTPLPIAAAKEAAGQAEMTLDEVAARGELIYRFDQAAWIASDEALRVLQEPTRVRGWTVEPAGDELLVTYYGLNGQTPFALFKAVVKDNQITSSHVVTEDRDRSLSAAALQIVRARDAALQAQLRPCADTRFNTVVLPPRADGTTIVYLLTPQTETGNYPVGGHYRLEVDAAGKVMKSRAFMNSCLSIPAPPANAVAFFLTHLLDPQPTEIHVFLSLWMAKPIGIGTKSGSWMVEGSHIRRFEAKTRKP